MPIPCPPESDRMLTTAELVERTKASFGNVHITPYSVEIAFWMARQAEDIITTEYVTNRLASLKGEYVTPFSVLKHLQTGLTEDEQKATWPVFQRAVKVLDQKLSADFGKAVETLVEEGYTMRSACDMKDYVQRERKKPK
jgi:hypothetical protein